MFVCDFYETIFEWNNDWKWQWTLNYSNQGDDWKSRWWFVYQKELYLASSKNGQLPVVEIQIFGKMPYQWEDWYNVTVHNPLHPTKNLA
jgi:hypothetical protein